MQMQFNPANTNLARDFTSYKQAFEQNVGAKAEIKHHLEKVKIKVPDPADPTKQIEVPKYPQGTPENVYTGFAAYQDFAFGGGGNVDRLGGSLGLRPGHLDNLQAPNPGQFAFSRGHGNPPPNPPSGTVKIRADGAILHNPDDVPSEADREAAHHYMHHVFDDILYEARDLLEAINIRLSNYTATPTKANRDFYAGAVMNFDDFRASLKTRLDHNYSQAFNWVTIDPVVTNEGYIVSARIEVNWKNPYHSSSTIRVP